MILLSSKPLQTQNQYLWSFVDLHLFLCLDKLLTFRTVPRIFLSENLGLLKHSEAVFNLDARIQFSSRLFLLLSQLLHLLLNVLILASPKQLNFYFIVRFFLRCEFVISVLERTTIALGLLTVLTW